MRQYVGWTLSVAGGAIVLGLLVWLVLAALGRDTRQDIDLGEIGNGSTVALRGWHDATSELCRDVAGCTQGYRSDYVNVFRFDSIENSTVFADAAPERYPSNWIVVEYADGRLSKDDREDVQLYLDGLATSGG
jgi:hypothetical protein